MIILVLIRIFHLFGENFVTQSTDIQFLNSVSIYVSHVACFSVHKECTKDMLSWIIRRLNANSHDLLWADLEDDMNLRISFLSLIYGLY